MKHLEFVYIGLHLNFQQPHTSPVGIVGLNGKRLLVKVVKAAGIGGDKGSVFFESF